MSQQTQGTKLSTVVSNEMGRRGFLNGMMGLMAGGHWPAAPCPCNRPAAAAEGAGHAYPFGKPLKAAFSNAGLEPWCAHKEYC